MIYRKEIYIFALPSEKKIALHKYKIRYKYRFFVFCFNNFITNKIDIDIYRNDIIDISDVLI